MPAPDDSEYEISTDKQRLNGFARVITDQATFAYLADVFILEPHRKKGLSKRLMESIAAHPNLQGNGPAREGRPQKPIVNCAP